MIFQEDEFNEFFLWMVSDSLITNPLIIKDLVEVYMTDKFKYYEKSKTSKYYDHQYITGRQLKAEVEIKRIYGVISCAEIDDLLKKKVLEIVSNRYHEMYQIIKKDPNNLYEYLAKKEKNERLYEKKNALINIPFYLLHHTYGENCDYPVYKFLFETVRADIAKMLNIQSKREDRIKNFKTSELTSKYYKLKELTNSLKSEEELSVVWDHFRTDISFDEMHPIYHTIKNKLEIQNAVFAYSIWGFAFDCKEISISQVLRNISLSKAEVQEILAACYYANLQVFDVADEKFDAAVFVNAVLTWSMLKEYSRVREFYFENNSETQFLEINSKDKMIKNLEDENKKLNETIFRLNEKLAEFDKEKQKNIAQNVSSYKDDIVNLKNQNKILKEDLDTERARAFEVNKLREFVFSLKSDYSPQNNNLSLNELIKDRKIVIITGHEQWRNKLRKNFPFDYIGRLNLELAEKEMIDILTKT